MAEARKEGEPPEYLTVAQVARRLGCSVSLVQKWRRLGWLKATRLGTADVAVYGYDPHDVDEFAQHHWNRRRGRPPRPTRADESPPERRLTRHPVASLPPLPQASAPPARISPPSATGGLGGPRSQPASPAAQSPPLPPATGAAEPHLPPAVQAQRALALWDSDPRHGRALVLARFRPEELGYALTLAAAWAHRYDTLALGHPATAGDPLTLLAVWHNGRPQDPRE